MVLCYPNNIANSSHCRLNDKVGLQDVEGVCTERIAKKFHETTCVEASRETINILKE